MYICIECKSGVSVRLDTKENGLYESDPHPLPGTDDEVCTGRARDPEIWEMIPHYVNEDGSHTAEKRPYRFHRRF